MSRKDLIQKLNSVTSDVPLLVGYYKSATREIFGVRVDVAKYTYEKFEEKSKELRDLNIPLREYSYGVLKILKSWADQRNFRQLPINVFLGDWALKKFRNVHDSEFVDFHLDDEKEDEEVLLHTELQVARYYIESASEDFVRFCDCVEELRPVLDSRWLALYDSGSHRVHIVGEVLDILEKEYYVDCATSYTDFVDAKVMNGG